MNDPSNYPPGVTGNEPEIRGEEYPEPVGMEAMADVPIPKAEDKVPTPPEAYRAAMAARFGEAWRESILVEVGVADLSWIIDLAWCGLAQRRKDWEDAGGGKLSYVERLNIAEFRRNLDWLVEAASKAPAVRPESKKGRKSRKK